MDNNLLLCAKDKIESAYTALGYQLGWSFLYTPAKTLTPSARFLFMGMNPGGKETSFSLSTEEGNAYDHEVEPWTDDGSPTSLQKQVVALYNLLANKLKVDRKILMNATLAANFCPFRSPTWGELKDQNKAVNFSRELWTDLLERTNISTVVCMSSVVFQQMTSILAENATHILYTQHAAGWGKIQYYVKEYDMKGRKILVVGLPHLSRYQIFNRIASNSQAEEIADKIADSLEDWSPGC